MSVIATYKTLRELRRDRRYPVPVLRVTIGENSYTTSNWSMGGLLVTEFSGTLPSGAVISGTLRVVSGGPELPFRGLVARCAPASKKLAIKFTSCHPEMVTELDRGMSRRLRR